MVRRTKIGKLPKVLFFMSLKLKNTGMMKKLWGIIEVNGKFIGLACLVAKEITDKESFVKRLG